MCWSVCHLSYKLFLPKYLRLEESLVYFRHEDILGKILVYLIQMNLIWRESINIILETRILLLSILLVILLFIFLNNLMLDIHRVISCADFPQHLPNTSILFSQQIDTELHFQHSIFFLVPSVYPPMIQNT